jgi:hypothetical protein
MIDPAVPARSRGDRVPPSRAACRQGILRVRIAAAALLLLLTAAPARAGLLETSCFPGTASRTGMQPCSACPAGSFASGSGATSCDLCPIGSFAAGSGNTVCQPCAAGTYADEAGSAICVRDQVAWPSAAVHCGNGDALETCIALGIRDGGIVEIAANDIAAQSVSVTGKSFTLRPQPGFVPTFGVGTTIVARGSEADVGVVIEGLVIESGLIAARQAGPHRFEATIRDNEIQRSSNVAIEVSSLLPSNAGPTLARVEDNRVTIDRSQTFSASVRAIQGSFAASGGVNDLVIRSNEIEQRNTGQAGAIEISNSAGSLTLDVIGNRIDGADFNNGVQIVEGPAATTSGLVANNAVSGQASSGGVTGAIGVRLDGESSDLAIVNNSVAFNESGVRIDGLSESIDAVIANNVIAFNELGLLIQADGVANDSNLVFDNGFDLFTPGPGTIAADPLFVAKGFPIDEQSPAHDAGNSAQVPLDLTVDLLGNPRIVGSSVDIGAFEVPEPATGLGVAALATLAALRRCARRHARALHRAVALAAIASGLAASPAGADFIFYSWSGRVEPANGAGNPWGILGDGSALTADGTPYKVRALVATDAEDLDGTLNPDFARFAPTLLLQIGNEIAGTSNAQLRISDQLFPTQDAISLSTTVELIGIPLAMVADIRLPNESFALSDEPAPDPPPTFFDSLPLLLGGASTQDLLTIPDNATVTGRLQICGDETIPVSWDSTTTGTAGDIAVTIEGLLSPDLSPGDFEFQGADFAASPLCSTTLQLEYLVASDWTATLEQPVAALLVYAKFWRGPGSGADPVAYRFDAPFTIESGFTQASVSEGNTVLSVPGSAFHDGILRFDGPIASLGVDSNATLAAAQVMTLAVEAPEPGAAATVLAALATLFGMSRRRIGRRSLAPLRIAGSALALLAVAGEAGAAGVVGNGTPESCTGSAFANALVGGGLVTFECGAEPANIVVDTAVIANGTTTTVDGGGLVQLDGDVLRQIFFVLAGGDLTLRDVMLVDGNSGTGGALRNEGTARLERVMLFFNQTEGIGGGAIYNAGTLHVADSSFLGNGNATVGGALLNASGSAAIDRCEFRFNGGSDEGGAIAVEDGAVVVTNSTFAFNTATDGGGIFAGGGSIELQNVTLDDNRADHGGAVFLTAGTATARNTVFSRSRDRDGTFESLECDGTGGSVASLGGNLASDGSCGLSGTADRNATDPLLGFPDDNGGPTFTILPLPGSPLIDGGLATGCPPTDQRGFPRPVDGGAPDTIAQCDVGAVEVPEPAAAWIAAFAALAGITRIRRRPLTREPPLPA